MKWVCFQGFPPTNFACFGKHPILHLSCQPELNPVFMGYLQNDRSLARWKHPKAKLKEKHSAAGLA